MMNPKGYYTTVFSVIALALVASYILYPNFKEESLMYFYDLRYEDAYERFSKLYDDGDRTVSVAIPLVWLDLHFAQGDHAAQVLEDYIEEHPDDMGAKQYLKEILKDLSRPHQYLSVSREIYGIKSPKEGLTYEEKLHLHLGDFRGQEVLLKEMVTDGTGSQEQYVEYAYLLASEGKIDEAVQVIKKLVEDKPFQEIGQDTMIFVIRVLLDFGDKEQARALAIDYLQHFTKFKTTFALIGLFDSRGDDQFVIDLIDRLPISLQNHPVIVMNRAKQLIELGKSDLAYHFVLKQFGTEPPQAVQRDFFLLALDQEEDEEKLIGLSKKIQFSTFKNGDLYRMMKLLAAKNHQALSRELGHSKSLDIADSSPALSSAFELAKHPPCEAESGCAEAFQINHELSDADCAFLASIYHLKGYKEQAKEQLLEVESLKNIQESELFELAGLYIDLDLSDEGLELVEDLREEKPSKESEVDEAWVILAAAEEQVSEVMEFLDQDETVDEEALEKLFYLSLEKEYHKLAYNLAVELNEKERTPQRKEMLGLALIFNDQVEEGLDLLDEVNKVQFGQSENYFYGLTVAAKKEKKYREDLKNAISEKLRLDGLTEKERRNYAYILMDNEFREDAASLFFELAQTKTFDNTDVQTLLHAWGKELSDEQMEWLLEKAETSEGSEKGRWLEQLVYVGNLQGVVDITTPNELGVDTIADAYLAAALTLNNKQIVTSAVTSIYPKEQRLPKLLELGNIARDHGLSDIARDIYLRILEENPSDSKALEAMGGLYFDEGAYCIAKSYFKKYLQCTEEDNYLVNYYLGEILWVENKRCLARKFYNRSLYLICHDETQVPSLSKEETEDYITQFEEYENHQKSKHTTQAQIYHRLDKTYLAASIYRNLLQKYPKALHLRLEFANMMMDIAKYRSAAHLLCQPCFSKKSLEDPALNVDFYLAKARLLRETNHVAKSIGLLQNISCHSNEYARLDASLADSYFTAGHWHQSMHFINQALKKQPLNEFYREARKEIVWEHLPSAILNYEYRKTGIDQREHFFRYHAFTPLSPWLAIAAKADVDKIELDDLTSVTDGVTAPFKGVRKKGELSLFYSNLCGDVRKGSLYYAEGIFGAGIEWKKYSYRDIYTFGFDWQRPDWEDIQATIERGARDQIYLERYHRFNRFWEVNIGLAGNRYNLWHFPSAAVTWQVEGLLTYRIPQQPSLHRLMGEEADLTFNYQLDKEQIDRLKKKTDINGEKFAPLPLTNRETHSLFIFLSKVLHKCLATEGYFGYLYDRVTGGSLHPVGGAAVILWERQKTQGRFDYNHSVSTEDTTNTVDSFMFNLRHIF
ncbi:MAG: hypothetical protein AAGG81_02100 [Chlamydiota bacterium]